MADSTRRERGEEEQRGPELSMLGSTRLKGLHTGKEDKMGWKHRAVRDQGPDFSTRGRASAVGIRVQGSKRLGD